MDCRVLAGAIASTILATGLAAARPTERQVTFRPGAVSAELRGVIRGDADVTYRVTTVPGQTMQVLFRPSNRSCYFNAFEPGRADAVHMGSSAGNEFSRTRRWRETTACRFI